MHLIRFTIYIVFYIITSVQFTNGETAESNPHRRSTQPSSGNDCLRVDQMFRDHILKIATNARDQFRIDYGCLINSKRTMPENVVPSCEERNSRQYEKLSKYRTLLRKYRSCLGRKWASTYPDQNFLRQCIGQLSGDEFLSNNSRFLKIRNDSPACQPIATSWSHELINLEGRELLKSEPIQGISKEEWDYIKEFRKSPLGRSVSQNSVSIMNRTTDQDKSELIKRAHEFKFSLEKLVSYIEGLEDHELHELYMFESQFKMFASNSDIGQQKANACRDSSTFIKDCAILINLIKDSVTVKKASTNRLEAKRCGSRNYNLFFELAPGLSIVDGLSKSEQHWGAYLAGLESMEEFQAGTQEATTQVVFGLLERFPARAIARGLRGAADIATTAMASGARSRASRTAAASAATSLPRQTYAQILNRYPALQARFARIERNRLLPVAKQINKPDEIPFALSDEYRRVSSEVMRARVKELTPEISNTIVKVYNKLGDREELKPYFQKLFKEVAEHMANSNKKAYHDLLNRGELSLDAISAVLAKRFKSRGDTAFTRIRRDRLLFGRRQLNHSDLDLDNPNQRFRAAVREGPFVDAQYADMSESDHGSFTHMLQRDIIHDVVKEGMKGKPQEFWNFLSTTKGVHWWMDLFDAGEQVGSFHRPEALVEYLKKMTTGKFN